MNWIESHKALASHPKTRRLARTLEVSLPAAIGHLHLLWWFVAEYALDGDLSRFEPGDIADGALWEGDPEDFVQALRAAGFLDGDRVHDWGEYVGRYAKAQAASTLGNHRRWHEGPEGRPSSDCPLCLESAPTTPPIPHPIPPDVPTDSADLTRPDLTRQTRPDQDPKARGSAALAGGGNVGTPLGEVLTQAPPPPAPGLSEVEDGLVRGLRELDPVWRKLTFGAVNKLNRAWGRPVVVMALQRAREEKAVPAVPYPFLDAICKSIAEKVSA